MSVAGARGGRSEVGTYLWDVCCQDHLGLGVSATYLLALLPGRFQRTTRVGEEEGAGVAVLLVGAS